MNLPTEFTLPALRQALQDIHSVLRPLQAGVVDLHGGRVIGAGKPIDAKDYVRKFDLEQTIKDIEATKTVKTVTPGTALAVATAVRIGAYAIRGAAAAHANELFLASDRDYIGFISNGAVWYFAFGVHRAAVADRPTPTSDETNYAFYATDTFVLYYWDGAAWLEDILSTIERFGGLTSSFPALKRSTTILQVKLADDSAYTDLEVLDEVYGAGWDGSVEVPTKNAVYDKIQTLLGSSAYTPTNVTTDRSYDANATTVDELADVVGTLVADLQGKGILT